MKFTKNAIIGLVLVLAVCLYSSRATSATDKSAISGWIKGGLRAPAIIIVYEEKPDNSKGPQVFPEQWIQKGQVVPIATLRGRMIYDYKFSSSDSWKTDNHASVSRDQNNPTTVP